MKRKLMVALIAVTLMTSMAPLPAEAASNYCSVGQTTWQKSNMTTGTARWHNWIPVGGVWHDKGFAYTGWKYSNTGVEDVSVHSYTANGNVPYYAAYCVTGPS